MHKHMNTHVRSLDAPSTWLSQPPARIKRLQRDPDAPNQGTGAESSISTQPRAVCALFCRTLDSGAPALLSGPHRPAHPAQLTQASPPSPTHPAQLTQLSSPSPAHPAQPNSPSPALTRFPGERENTLSCTHGLFLFFLSTTEVSFIF